MKTRAGSTGGPKTGVFQQVYMSVLFLLADIAAFITYLRLITSAKRNKIIYNNIRSIFPEISPAAAKQLSRKFNKHMSRTGVSYFIQYLTPVRYMSEIIRFENTELLDELYQQRKTVLLIFPHYDNWTYINAFPLYTKYQVIATHGMKTNGFFDMMRARYGAVLIRQNKIYRSILKSAQDGKSLYLILPDQLPVPPYKNEVSFFGAPLYIQVGVDRIMENIDAVPVYMEVKKRGKYRYTYSLRLFNEIGDRRPVLERFYAELEDKIRDKPELWMRWSIERWNTRLAKK